mgnify:CR=1 FL=1
MPNFPVERRIISDQIRARLSRIQKTIFTRRSAISTVQYRITGQGRGPERPPRTGWKPFSVPGFWGGYDQTTWFRLRWKVPRDWKGRSVVAFLRPQGESLAYVNGKPAQGIDNGRDWLLLTENAREGELFEILLESVPSTRFDEHRVFEYADVAIFHREIWETYWDFRVALETWRVLPADYAPAVRLLDVIDASIKKVELNFGDDGTEHISRTWRGSTHPDEEKYIRSLKEASELLRGGLKEFPSSPLNGKMIFTGHSHIDTAWLWPIRETQRKCGRTFSTVLALMKRYPEYHFSCSQPAQYEFVKTYYPDLYRQIKRRVKEGRWEPNGCFWVEPDLNIPSGEALIRQAVYGNRFFREEFGVHSRVAWVPDTFGYCWALPQILKKAQVDYLVTSKLDWNQYTEFPYTFFEWEGTDGSRVTVIRPYNYNGNICAQQVAEQWNRFKEKDRADTTIFPFGYGDGGGGPTPEMIENGKRLQNIVGLPQCEFGTVSVALEQMAQECPRERRPVWNGELYFELHRGCQTSQSRNKRNNRRAELLMRDVELWSTLAFLRGGTYRKKEIRDCWKQVLTCQFHDILPGTSITEVYRWSDKVYAELFEQAADLRERALNVFVPQKGAGNRWTSLAVFNSLSWARSGLVEFEGKLPKADFVLENEDGVRVSLQRLGANRIVFKAEDVPPLGWATYRLVSGESEAGNEGGVTANVHSIENELIRVELTDRGTLQRVYDKRFGRDVLPQGSEANVLQFFEDFPHVWEAWDIDFNFEQKRRTFDKQDIESIEVVESGPLRAIVRVTAAWNRSRIIQDIRLDAGSPRIDFVTRVHWHEKRTLLKAAFPVDVRSSFATYEVQFGAIERPTHRSREFDAAQFEVPAQKWADLSEGDYGVSLLNDCKYGYDIKDNVLRISLLRSPVDPDPTADEGEHEFTYSLLPHPGDWRSETVREAYELNVPLMALPGSVTISFGDMSGLLVGMEPEDVIIDTVKLAEDSEHVILRLYEPYGNHAKVRLEFSLPLLEVSECDLMEENDRRLKSNNSGFEFSVLPFEIKTFKLLFVSKSTKLRTKKV